MDYRIEVYDTWNRRIASYDDVPLLEAVRTAPDQADTVRGVLPDGVRDLSHAYRVVVLIEGSVFCDARIHRVAPQWSDARKLILDRYVHFHEVIELEAETPALDGNSSVTRGYQNRTISSIVKDAINSANGLAHYLVNHTTYPDGANREYQKFLGRKLPANELGVGSITTGQWVGADRIDASGAYAKDGDTVAGLVVDGQPWPDLRLLMIDCEETSRNSHAWVRHPETAFWTDAEYNASGYKLCADAAKAALQDLITTKGISYIELNPHRDAQGAYDDRVDAYGRYVGLIFGGGECFNAALVEKDLADVYLYQDGRYHLPEMELKDFFSYCGANSDSIESVTTTLNQLDVSAGLFEVLAALAYAAGGAAWSVDADYAVRFSCPVRPDRVVFFDPVAHGVTLGSESRDIANAIYFDGNPLSSSLAQTYVRGPSIDEYGFHGRALSYFSISFAEDAGKLVNGLLDDLAYPEPIGAITFFQGDHALRVGDIVELRGNPLRRLERRLDGEWQNRFTGRLVARVKSVAHRFEGKHVTTTATFTSPFRSVDNPISFIVRSQPDAATLYEFRLDDAAVGLDLGYHLD
ncbi:MAG: thermonuclease family protein [Candidatus Hydrogenedentes bacterium]|nr:thermonuclease family protein [Candidatus Hydrogenedentota bacterium]